MSGDDLPDRFSYPPQLIRLIELGLTDLEPWRILGGAELAARSDGLKGRYPARVLVPFAVRIDNDDVACFDVDRGGRVSIVHDFASPGWEQQQELEHVYAWLRVAIEDLVEYDL